METQYAVIYSFPRIIVTSNKCFELMANISKSTESFHGQKILLDFSNTKRLETNLLVFLIFSLDRLNKRGNYVTAKLRNKKYLFNEKIIYGLFTAYSTNKYSFLIPRKIGIREERLTEDILLKYLKQMNLAEYEKIKIILSELIANIKMYSLYKEGALSAYINEQKNELIVSIANFDITFKGESYRNNVEFISDFDAVMWALKKNNSTRLADETGGLGLYILRKYISELDGRIHILSGKCCIELDGSCFNSENENMIPVVKCEEITTFYGGNVITLFIPYQIENNKIKADEREQIVDINNL